MNLYRSTVLVCGGTGCTSSGSHNILERFETLIRERPGKRGHGRAHGAASACAKLARWCWCIREGSFYSHVKVEDVDEIVSEHLIKGRIVTRLLQRAPSTKVAP